MIELYPIEALFILVVICVTMILTLVALLRSWQASRRNRQRNYIADVLVFSIDTLANELETEIELVIRASPDGYTYGVRFPQQPQDNDPIEEAYTTENGEFIIVFKET